VLDPANRFLTAVLAVGSIVLLIAIGVGERLGDRVLGQATDRDLQTLPVVSASPMPTQSAGPFGPNWKRSDTLSAAGDPRFPDPRIPPQPLPTVPPTPKPTPTPRPTPTPAPTPTPNPNLPVWRQQPLPTATAIPTESAAPSASPGRRPAVQPTPTLSPPP
jgi:hypothetical protein